MPVMSIFNTCYSFLLYFKYSFMWLIREITPAVSDLSDEQMIDYTLIYTYSTMSKHKLYITPSWGWIRSDYSFTPQACCPLCVY